MEIRLWTFILPVSLAAFSEHPWLNFGDEAISSLYENQASPLNVRLESGQSASAITHGLRLQPPEHCDASPAPNYEMMLQEPDDTYALKPDENWFAQAINHKHALDQTDARRKRIRLTENHNDHEARTIPEAHSSDSFPLIPSFESNELMADFQPSDHSSWPQLNYQNNPLAEVILTESHHDPLTSQNWMNLAHTSNHQVQHFEPYLLSLPTNFQKIDHSQSVPFNHQNNPTKHFLDNELNSAHQNNGISFSPMELGLQINSKSAQSSIFGETGSLGTGIVKKNDISLKKPRIPRINASKGPDHLLRLFNVEVVNFEPSSIDRELMLTAINCLKRPDGKKFINLFIDEIENKNKIICVLGESREAISQLMSSCERFLGHINRKSSQDAVREDGFGPTTKGKRAARRNNLLASFKKFITSYNLLNSNKGFSTKIDEYSSFVINSVQGKRSYLNFENKIQNNYGNNLVQAEEKIDDLKTLMSTLPMYLFYVDLINTIIPVGDLENGVLLQTERQIAAQRFFEIVDFILSKGSREELKLPNDEKQHKIIIQAVGKFRKDLWKKKGAVSFIWNILAYWILSSRKQLSSTFGFDPEPDNHFKGFFNYLFVSWQS